MNSRVSEVCESWHGGESGAALIGRGRTAIMIARSLSRAGYRTIVYKGTPASRSRYVDETWQPRHLVGDGRADHEAVGALLAQRDDISLVFPVNDVELLFYARNRNLIPSKVTLAMSAPEIVETCENKIRLMRFARQVGVDQEPFALVRTREALFDEAAKIGFPCVVKPADSQRQLFEKKALTCASLDALRDWFAEWPHGHDELIVQKFAVGERRDIQIAARAGAMLYAVELKVTRTDRADGTGSSTDGVTVPPTTCIHEDCRKLVRELDLTGVFLIQFLYDPDRHTSHLLEINPRPAANYTWAQRCGMDLPVLLVKLVRGEPTPELDAMPPYPAGLRFAWTGGDLRGITNALAKGEIGLGGALRWLGSAISTFLVADCHLTWSWRDPLPTLVMYAEGPFRLLGRLLR